MEGPNARPANKAKKSPQNNNNNGDKGILNMKKAPKKKKKQKKNSATCKEDKKAGKVTSSPECDVGTPREARTNVLLGQTAENIPPDSDDLIDTPSPTQVVGELQGRQIQNPLEQQLPQTKLQPKQTKQNQRPNAKLQPELTAIRLPVKVAFADRSPVPNRRKLPNDRRQQSQNKTLPVIQGHMKTLSPIPFNESLRWEYQVPDEEEEAERLRLYKMNRRKRYLAAQNELSAGSGSLSSASSSSLSPPNSSIQGRHGTSLPELMTSHLMTPRSLTDIHLDAVECS